MTRSPRTPRCLPAAVLTAAVLAGLGTARPAHAQFTVYTDVNGFTPAAKAVCPDIDNLLVTPTVGPNGPSNTVYGSTQDGIGITFNSTSLLTASGGQSDIDGPFKDITLTSTNPTLGLEVLEFNLNGALGTTGNSVTLNLSGGQTITQALDPGLTFFGVIADQGTYIQSATINSQGTIDDIRQVRVCAHPITTAAVPEAGSMALFGLGGLALLPVALRARRGRPTA